MVRMGIWRDTRAVEGMTWFLVSWPEGGRPSIEMEFWTRAEAEETLEAVGEVRKDAGGLEGPDTGICPGSALLRDPFLQEALVEWDARVDELESIERNVFRGS
jgi:hypothetical protein